MPPHPRSPCTIHLSRLAVRTLRHRAFVSLLLLLSAAAVLMTVCVSSILRADKHPHSRNKIQPPSLQPMFSAQGNPPRLNVVHHAGKNSSLSTSSSGKHFLTIIPRGRLGNQMFQYASLLGIADANGREPFVTSSCKVTHYFANVSISDRPVSGWDTLEEMNYAEKDSLFESLPHKNVRLKGFFQSWKYFTSISQKVRQAFVFLPDVQKAVQTLFTNYTRNVRDSIVKIGVHVRRTDMLHKITQKQGYVPAPLSYLKKAIQHMRVRFGYQSTVFFIVSDDPDWCTQHLLEKGVTIVDSAPSVVHLGFLALCDHVIMTVGTFGWWAAYLAGGHVVYYAGYPREGSEIAEGFNKQDFYLPHWVAIGD